MSKDGPIQVPIIHDSDPEEFAQATGNYPPVLIMGEKSIELAGQVVLGIMLVEKACGGGTEKVGSLILNTMGGATGLYSPLDEEALTRVIRALEGLRTEILEDKARAAGAPN